MCETAFSVADRLSISHHLTYQFDDADGEAVVRRCKVDSAPLVCGCGRKFYVRVNEWNEDGKTIVETTAHCKYCYVKYETREVFRGIGETGKTQGT